jgi:hypothetical protein
VAFARNTYANEWQECCFNLILEDVLTSTNQVSFKIQRGDSIGTGSIWLDDIKIFIGDCCFVNSPSTGRASFTGPLIRNDGLGNLQKKIAGVWTDFFPYGVHAGPPYTSANMIADYSDFNSIWDNGIFNSDPTSMLRVAAGAGMMTIAELKSIALPVSLGGDVNLYNNFDLLESKIATFVKDPNFASTFLCWYMDDEMPDDTDKVRAAFDLVRNYDADHPIFLHLHHPSNHRNYAGSPISFTGSYVSDISRNEFSLADRIEGNPFPLCVGQLSFERTAGSYRAQSYRALIMGARGLKYYRDYDKTDATNYPTKGFRNSDTYTTGMMTTVKTEIDAMMAAGIIQSPHWTDWSVVPDNKAIFAGGRMAGGNPYVLLANPYNASKTVTLTFSGVDIGTLKDFNNSLATVASVTSKQATIILPAYGCYALKGE